MIQLVNLARSLLDHLIPPSCLLCGASGCQDLCEPCQQDLPWLQTRCLSCALPLAPSLESNSDLSDSNSLCAHCLNKPPSFDKCVSAFRFVDPIGPLINQFKLRQNLRNGRILSKNLAQSIRPAYQNTELPEQLVPIPLHWRRVLRRGFNQATTISQYLGQEFKLPVNTLLKRRLPTPKQQGLNRKQRLSNLKNAFSLKIREGKSNQRPTNIPNHVALVDDVMTTGATAEAASQVLKQAGVQRVDVWVLARTPSPQE